MKFSANLGFLWADLSLPVAIRSAKAAGFDAVEVHWPYEVPIRAIQAALQDTGLPLLGLNTSRGNAGEMGLSALPGRETEARAAIDQAVAYGAELGARNVHVMAGIAAGPDAETAFCENLTYACQVAGAQDMTVLIEPLNAYDVPGYFLKTTTQAGALIDSLQLPNLKLMFDCYHVQLFEGDICNRLTDLMPLIGHIQFAGVPGRGGPDRSELNYEYIFNHLTSLGYDLPIGAEYKPDGNTDDTLGWLVRARSSRK